MRTLAPAVKKYLSVYRILSLLNTVLTYMLLFDCDSSESAAKLCLSHRAR